MLPSLLSSMPILFASLSFINSVLNTDGNILAKIEKSTEIPFYFKFYANI